MLWLITVQVNTFHISMFSLQDSLLPCSSSTCILSGKLDAISMNLNCENFQSGAIYLCILMQHVFAFLGKFRQVMAE